MLWSNLGKCLTTVDGRIVCPFKDSANLVPDGFPFGALTIQIEFGQDAFEPVDQFGMALKPSIRRDTRQETFRSRPSCLANRPLDAAPSSGCQGP
jgi:hypothetical protein